MSIHPLIDRITSFRKIIVWESDQRYTLNQALKEMCDSLSFDTPALINVDNQGEVKPEILTNAVSGFRIATGTGHLYLSTFDSPAAAEGALERAALSMTALAAMGALMNGEGKPVTDVGVALETFHQKIIWESVYRFRLNQVSGGLFAQLPAGTRYLITPTEGGGLDGDLLDDEPGGLRVRADNVYIYLSRSEEEALSPDGKKKLLELHTSLIRAGFYLPTPEDLESLRKFGEA